MAAQIEFTNNIKDCYPKKNEIADEIKSIFTNTEMENYKMKHSADKSGKSKVDSSDFQVDGGVIQVQCFDWSKNVEYTDKLLLNIKTDEALKYFTTAFN